MRRTRSTRRTCASHQRCLALLLRLRFDPRALTPIVYTSNYLIQKRAAEATTGSYEKSASCKFADIRLGAQYPPTRQFHALASNEKSIGRCDIIRRCTMGNKLRNYHTKRLPVPGTMATKPWNRLNGESARAPGEIAGWIHHLHLSKSAL